MQKISNKSKQFFTLLLKLIIVVGAFYFIYERLSNQSNMDFDRFKNQILFKQTWYTIVFILFLSVLNRLIEILKWKNLIQEIKTISLVESTKQVLGALTLALFTPNGIGEYAGKALFFEKNQTSKVIFLNLICNGVQLVLTVFFGILGLMYFNTYFSVVRSKVVFIVLGITVFLILIIIFFRKAKIGKYSIEKIIHKINAIPKKIHQKNLFLGVLRYLTFSHQYYFLFLMFGVDLPYLLLMSVITSVYFLASSLPSFQFLDFAVKGSVAVFFFGLLKVNEWVVLFISTLMWILNTVLPVVIGSYFVLNFKLRES
ncbi:flippase-like domain-containing protein [Flavobacterium covae]|uniref:lysylphosphatidylglycerol synthase domain-containing protein n=1 Tax=Flavobacterium covae TaxID=2906076 RepID=UPI001FB69B2A|nr:lysylphosphatidylglycerol synthase domain-containing protein [Flavobacterium covae]MCJ1807528.1 flippase-like domain-containing protein [Flavobacterium covae]